jgi:hypothetical protein
MADLTRSQIFILTLIGISGFIFLVFLASSFFNLPLLNHSFAYETISIFSGILCIFAIFGCTISYATENPSNSIKIRNGFNFSIILIGMEICPIYLLIQGGTSIWLDVYLITFVFVVSLSLFDYISNKSSSKEVVPWGSDRETAETTITSWGEKDTPPTYTYADPNIIYRVSEKGFVRGALLFSFILPGLGQTYNGQYLKGGIFSIVGLMAAWAFGEAAFAIWLIGTVEAYFTAKKITTGRIPKPMTGRWVFSHMTIGVYFIGLLLTYGTGISILHR